MEGEGRKMKVFIMERGRGQVSWIRFGEEGLKIILKGVDSYKREATSKEEFLNGRRTEEVTDWFVGKMLLEVLPFAQ